MFYVFVPGILFSQIDQIEVVADKNEKRQIPYSLLSSFNIR